MKLLNSLFNINNSSALDEGCSYSISLNREHFIYKAHFPDLPITPGVCIIQIVKELLENFIGEELIISNLKNAKFLSVVSPDKNQDICCDITKVIVNDNIVKSQAIVYYEDVTFAKVSLICKVI